MRILVTTDAVGGVWRYSLTLAREWARMGLLVELAVLGPAPAPAQWQEAAAIPGLILHQTDLALDWTASGASALQQVAADIAELAEALDVASVHLHAPALVGADVTWPVPVVACMHSCLLTWWRAMRHGPPPHDFAWRIDATRAGLRRATHVVAPSLSFREAVHAAYGGGIDIVAIPNGCDPPGRRGEPAAARPRGVLTAGRFWDEAKDAATLDAAAALLDAPVRAAGSFRGPDGQSVGTDRLQRLGVLDEPALAGAMAEARVFVSSARYEPFGLAVLEAAQGGAALVLSDIPSFRELWDGAALFVTPGDAAGFAAALSRALDDPAALAEAAISRAARYDARVMADATLALHRPVAHSKRIA